MTLFKHEFPILERDTNEFAVIMPNRHEAYSFPKKCVFAFLGDVTDRYAIESSSKQIGSFESITKVYPIYITTYKGEEVCYCQAPCGAAPATQILDFLIGYGVKEIIACGSCGTLTDIGENEILIPKEALRDEGTSYHYIAPSRTILLDSAPIEAISVAAKQMNINYEYCKSWTTDGFFRETKALIEYRKEEGCTVVEMECSALVACARFRNAQFGQILFAADTLHDPDCYDERDWGKSAMETAFILALDAVVLLNVNKKRTSIL